MEKTNKYYRVIEKLVKEHKKFAGNEEFLDDIIDDVYSHSEVVINSIANESVIDAYLKKVVGISIITVPKRLGKHQEIQNKEPEPIQEIFLKNHVNTELVDKMINSAPRQTQETDNEVDDIENQEQADDDTCFEELNIQSESDEQVIEQEETDSSDILELELSEENSSFDNNVYSDANEDNLSESTTDNSPEKDDDDELDIAYDENVGALETEELNPQEETLNIDLDTDSEDESLGEDLLAPVELDDNSDLLNIEMPEDVVLDDVSESISVKQDEDEFKPTDYSVFNYNPENSNNEIDEEEIANSIRDLDKRKPDLNILKVYNLKYKESNTISEIASKLNMEKNDVKEAVSELISVI